MVVSSTFPLVDLASRPQGLEAFFRPTGVRANSSLVRHLILDAATQRKSLIPKRSLAALPSSAVLDDGVKDFHRVTEPNAWNCPLKLPAGKKKETFRLQLLWPQSLPQQGYLPSPP
jgi:hypothetical protein